MKPLGRKPFEGERRVCWFAQPAEWRWSTRWSLSISFSFEEISVPYIWHRSKKAAVWRMPGLSEMLSRWVPERRKDGVCASNCSDPSNGRTALISFGNVGVDRRSGRTWNKHKTAIRHFCCHWSERRILVKREVILWDHDCPWKKDVWRVVNVDFSRDCFRIWSVCVVILKVSLSRKWKTVGHNCCENTTFFLSWILLLFFFSRRHCRPWCLRLHSDCFSS